MLTTSLKTAPQCHRNLSTACQSETFSMDYEGQWHDRGRNFESSSWPPRFIKKHSVRLEFVRLLCASLRVGWCMELQLWRHPLGSGFVKGTRHVLAWWTLSIISSRGLNRVGTEKSSPLAHFEVTLGLAGKAEIDEECSCGANDVSMNVESETISTHKKSCSKSPQRKRKREIKWMEKREKKEEHSNNQRKHTRKLAQFVEKAFKVMYMNCATEILPPREIDRRRSKRSLPRARPFPR